MAKCSFVSIYKINIEQIDILVGFDSFDENWRESRQFYYKILSDSNVRMLNFHPFHQKIEDLANDFF